jgi:hypothetical protein
LQHNSELKGSGYEFQGISPIACRVGNGKVEPCGHQHDTIGEAERCRMEIVVRFFQIVDIEGERPLNDEEFEVWRGLEKSVLSGSPPILLVGDGCSALP